MTFLGISMIISAAIIAASFIYLFKASIKLYKETYSSLFKDDDPVETPDSSNDAAIKLRDDIMSLDIEENEWFIVNTIMDLIDKNFGEEELPEEDNTPEIKFGGF